MGVYMGEQHCVSKCSLRYQIINHLILANHYKTYLEIGIAGGDNFMNVNCFSKRGVDIGLGPEINGELLITHGGMTSDEYFQNHKDTFDIVFIDGLHTMEQVDKDIVNSLDCLNPGGTIVLHDCLPISERAANQDTNGTAWMSVAKLRLSRSDLYVRVVDADHGCGIVQKSDEPQPLFTIPEFFMGQDDWHVNDLTYDFLATHRNQLMNVITQEQFCHQVYR